MKTTKNIPILRFPEFIDQWKNKKLGEIGKFKNGLNKGKKDFGFGTPFVNLMDVFGKQVLIESDFGLVNASKKELDSYNLVRGDILFIRSSVKRTGVGQAILITKNYSNTVYSGFLIRFRLFYKMELLYKRYCFSVSSFRKELLSLATSSANTNINQESLEKISVSFPSSSEQTKIAEFLSEIDKKIKLLTKKKQGLESYKKGIMQKIFNQEIRFKDNNRNDYPDWEEKKFSKYIKLYRGSSPRPISMYVTNDENGVNWIKIGDTKKVKNFAINNVSEKITREGSLKSRQVKKGELILANSMSFGKTYLLELDGCIYDGWFVLREYEELYNKSFLIQLLNSEFLQRQYKRLSTGGVVQNISSEIVYSTNLLKPTLPEQAKIADYLSDFDTKISQVSYQLDNIKGFKKGLLQQMFV